VSGVTGKTRDEALITDSGRVVLSVGPQDVDAAAAVTRNLGVHNKAAQLLTRHARMYPVALRTALSRPLDGDRSAFVREHQDLIDAVAEAAGSIKGRKAFLPKGAVIESVDVRGDLNVGRIFAILFRAESGRSARGVINYDAVPAVERAFQRHAEAAIEASPSDAPEGADAQAAADAEERLQALEKQLQDLAAENASLKEEADAGTEPFDGYEELNAEDTIKRVHDGGYLEFGKQGLQAIIDFEERQPKPRKTVIAAAEEELDAIPAEVPEDSEA
jgi:hypothetical protein